MGKQCFEENMALAAEDHWGEESEVIKWQTCSLLASMHNHTLLLLQRQGLEIREEDFWTADQLLESAKPAKSPAVDVESEDLARRFRLMAGFKE